MKIKLIAVAALAVCGSGAFAATAAPAAPNAALCAAALKTKTAVDLVNMCAPEAIVNVMGASAQQPAVLNLLTRADGGIFDNTMPLAVVTTGDGGAVAADATHAGVGAKASNTTIVYGYGAGGYSKTNPYGGKRLAVVANFSNGSFAGLNAMVNTIKAPGTTGTEALHTGIYFNETLAPKLLAAADAAALTCTVPIDTVPALAVGSASSLTRNVTCSTGTDRSAVRDYVNELSGKTPRGVQLVTLDVPPEFATPGVVSKSYSAKAVSLKETGVQGFGIVVNNALLAALIQRDIAANKLASSCNAVTAYTNLTADCQPSITRAEVAQFVTGKGTAATLLAGNTTPVTYFRRVPFSGTQAVSNIVFAGQGASTDSKALAAYYTKTSNTFMGYQTAVGIDTTSTWDIKGNFTTVANPGLTVKGMVGSGDVLGGIAGATGYALGLVSLEKARTSDGTIAKNGVSWVKVDGISPNSDGTAWDASQRVGFAKGYPLQFNTVAAVNAATKDAGQINVVNTLVAALKDPSYDLPGVAYLDKAAVTAASKTNAAPYTRTINAYAPLSLNQ